MAAGLAVDAGGERLLVANFEHDDLAGRTPAVAGRIPVGGQPDKMLLDRGQTRLFVTNGNGDTVAVIDTATEQVIETIRTTSGPSL